MNRLKQLFSGQKQSGDTIVEVLISMSILALVLVISFASTSRSLHSGTEATNRQQALTYAQQQVEVIKNAAIANAAALQTYEYTAAGPGPASPIFCIDASQSGNSSQSYGFINSRVPGTPASCQSFGGSQYTVSDTYNNGLFNIKITWAGSGSGGQSTLSADFRVPNANSITQSSIPVISSFSTSSACQSAVNQGTTCPLSWSVVNSTTCSASSSPNQGDWNSSAPASLNNSSGSANVTINASTTYTLKCSNGALFATATVTITMIQPPPTVTTNPATNITTSSVTLNGTVNPQGNSTTCYFTGGPNNSVTGNVNCVSSPGSGNSPVAVAVSYTSLSPGTQYNFQLCATNSGGTQCGAVLTFTTQNLPAPTVSISANPTTVSNGGTSVVSWSSTNATGCTASGNWSGAKAASGSASTGALSGPATYSYGLSCTGQGGTSPVSTASVTAGSPPPQVTGFTASPSAIAYGGSTTLSWSSAYSDGCLVQNVAWVGTSGSIGVGPLYSTTTYELDCYRNNYGWSSPSYVTVTVSPPNPSVTSFYVSPNPIAYGGSTGLYWSSANADGCVVQNVAWVGTSGGIGVGPLYSTTTYELDCYKNGVGWSSPAYATVSVNPPQPQVTGFVASPSTIAYGGSTTLYWSSAYSDGCLIQNVAWVGTSGSIAVGPLYGTTTYELDCYKNNVGWSSPSYVTVTVNPPQPQVTGFVVSPNPIGYGGSTVLYWSSAYSDGCLIQNVAWVGTSGGIAVGPLYSTTTYELDCYKNGVGWSSPAYVTVTVNPPSPQINYFVSSPQTINYGGSSALYWDSSYTDGCLIPNVAWVGTSGGYGVGPLYGTTTYELDCYENGVGWVGPVYATVYVNQPPDCNDRTHTTYGTNYGGQTVYFHGSVDGDNPCGVGIGQCDLFTPYTTLEYDFGDINPVDYTATGNPALDDVSEVGCLDYYGVWDYAAMNPANGGGGGGGDQGGGGGGGNGCDGNGGVQEDQAPNECVPIYQWDSYSICYNDGGNLECTN